MTEDVRNEEQTDESEPQEDQGEVQQPAEETGGEAEASSEPEFEPPHAVDVDVYDMLRAAIGLFAQEAWIALGVQARPGTIETRTNLQAARVAIDTTGYLIDQLGDQADADERREYNQIMTDLRMNFLRRQSKTDEES